MGLHTKKHPSLQKCVSGSKRHLLIHITQQGTELPRLTHLHAQVCLQCWEGACFIPTPRCGGGVLPGRRSASTRSQPPPQLPGRRAAFSFEKREHYCGASCVAVIALDLVFTFKYPTHRGYQHIKPHTQPQAWHPAAEYSAIYVVSLGSFSRCGSAGSEGTRVFKGFEVECQIALQKAGWLDAPHAGLRGVRLACRMYASLWLCSLNTGSFPMCVRGGGGAEWLVLPLPSPQVLTLF